MNSIIIYSTKYGSAEKAAILLKSNLKQPFRLVNIMKENPPSLDDYDTVILGGSIYIGKVQKQLVKYMSSNLTQLKTKKLGLFLCAAEQDEALKAKELADAFPDALGSIAVYKAVLGFEIKYDKLSFLEKKIMSGVKGYKESHYELSDLEISKFAKAMEQAYL